MKKPSAVNILFFRYILTLVLILALIPQGISTAKSLEPRELLPDSIATDSGTTTRVSVSSMGVEANNTSYGFLISTDGRYVAFTSTASNLVEGDTNVCEDVFVHDRQNGVTTLISVSNAGILGDKTSEISSINGDGRYVVFESQASNLVEGDTNENMDVFVHDRQSGETTLVSVSSANVQGNDVSYDSSISADGRYVAFGSFASNLVEGDTNENMDVFVHDRQSGETTLVSVSSTGIQGVFGGSVPSISADGRFVAFASWSNLIEGGKNDNLKIFIHDRQSGETSLVSVSSAGVSSNANSYRPSISADGRYVAFSSYASNLVEGDTNENIDVFVHDRQSEETSLVSISSANIQGNDGSEHPSISADGRYVGFSSYASNLVEEDTNENMDVFVHDRQSGETSLVSVSIAGVSSNANSAGGSISADGRYVVFGSWASDLVLGDTNESMDGFVHDRGEVYTVSGSILAEDLSALTDVTINLLDTNGDSFSSVTNTSDGSFSITGVPAGEYTLTPVKSDYVFSPESRSITVPPDAADQDFTASPEVYIVAGSILAEDLSALTDVTINLLDSNSDLVSSVVNDSDGSFSITGVPAGDYTLTPVKSGYSFTPESRSITVPPDASDQDFSAAFVAPHSFTKTSPIHQANILLPEITLTWSESALVDEFTYCIDTIDDDNCNTEWISVGKNSSSTTSINTAGTHYWQVRSSNAHGEAFADDGVWWSFSMFHYSPSFDKKLTASKVTFTWDAIPEAVNYKLQLSTDPNFSVLLLNIKTPEPTYFFDSFLQNNKTYYWRIRPFYADSKDPWLPTWNFTSMDALAKPTLTTPGHRVTLTISKVTFAWDPVENADQYKVVIAKDALFQNKVTSFKTTDTTATFNLPDGKYFWRVRPLDPYGAKGPWSDYRKFTVDAE